jgi:hypothetical protein
LHHPIITLPRCLGVFPDCFRIFQFVCGSAKLTNNADENDYWDCADSGHDPIFLFFSGFEGVID